MDLVALFRYLDTTVGWDGVRQFFIERAYMANTPPVAAAQDTLAYLIKYLEHNRIWKPRWARQARGTAIMKLPSGKITCMKSLLQRGSELLTEQHMKEGITENEDISTNDFDHLDEYQIELFKKFRGVGGKVHGYLTFKKDGSLLGVILYLLGTEEQIHMKFLIESSTDPRDKFAQMIIRKAEELGLPFMPIICSQGTLTMGEGMIPYTVTAIAGGIAKIPYTFVCEKADAGMTAIDFMETYCAEEFLTSIAVFYNDLPPHIRSETMTLSFETIVPNRREAWGDIHTELAISYPKASCRFLGCTFMIGDTPGSFRSHFQLHKSVKKAGWEEPMCWKIGHTKQIESMLKGLSDILMGSITDVGFIEKFKPFNKSDLTIDFEGFVYFDAIEDSFPLGLSGGLDFDLDYEKAKSIEYYKGHKFRIGNVPYLMSLSERASEIFPLVRAIKDFYGDLDEKLAEIFTLIREILIAAVAHDHEVFHGIPEGKAKVSFMNKSDMDVKSRMAINISLTWPKYCIEAFQTRFTALPDDEDDVHSFLKKLTMTVKPWNDEYNKTLTQMVSENHPLMNELFDNLVKYQNVIAP